MTSSTVIASSPRASLRALQVHFQSASSERERRSLSARSILAETEIKQLTRSAWVELLVARGASRVTAERIVDIGRGDAEPGRARRHTQLRR